MDGNFSILLIVEEWRTEELIFGLPKRRFDGGLAGNVSNSRLGQGLEPDPLDF